MDFHCMIILFSCALIFLESTSAKLDSIYANHAITDGDTRVSHGKMYELGFFSPGKSKNRYLGIWYKKISPGTVVWVANRETPITDKSGMLKLSRNGNLQILSGGSTVIWSSNSMASTRSNDTMTVVQLLDTGNLVLWDRSSRKQRVIWQSFDYPGNTVLPGMKFGKNLVTGRESSLIPWKSADDPSPSLYYHWLDANGYPQIFVRHGSVLLRRYGPWNGLKFQGLPLANPNPTYLLEFVCDEEEVYYRFELKTSVLQRILVRPDDTTVMLHWIDQIQDWAVYGFAAERNQCGRYGLCGPYGICSNIYPSCECMAGFRPRIPDEWDKANGSSGCVRKRALECGNGDGFKKISGVMFPDTRRSWYNHSMTLKECEMVCRRNCNCTAYANSDIRNGGSGCLLWFGELIDITEYDEKQDLYIKLAASELADSQTSFNKTARVVTAVISTSSVVVLLFAVVYACIKKKRRAHMKERGNRYGLYKKSNSISVQMEDLDELPFFSLNEISKATNDFSINNKIGEGGFGPVYKGVLEDGQEVAVKRLSETSQQGFDEFMNEIKTIAKLQHRNLVKLLGCCVHENELILIYEYMTNKSLDLVLFDETRSMMLDWPQRFNIIQGMARGILYLHQDSRLQIIHRDLKAGNILLDAGMNPRISDFGLARKFEGFDATTKTKKVVGTYGYIPPEYALFGRFSVKSDVFSFGVLVLETVSGKRNREFCYDGHNDNLLGHAWRLYRQGRSIELTNESLHGSCNVSEVLRSIQVGLLCVQHHAEDRPTMLSVVLMLVSEGALPQPKQPAFFSEESRLELDSVSSVDEYLITLLYAR